MTSAASPRPRRVVVVGAGVVGATAAARLAEQGVEVVLLSAEAEAEPEAGAGPEAERGVGTPVSRASFAWVNAHRKSPAAYRRLNEDGRRRHHELSAAHRMPWFQHTGAVADGVELPEDGYVDTAAYLAAQLDDLHRAGGVVHHGTPVRSIAHARQIAGGADVVLVAAGSGTAALVGEYARPRLTTSAGHDGFLARIEVAKHPIDRILSIDGLQVRPDGPGRMAAQSLALEAALRSDGVAASLDTVWHPLRAELERTLSWGLPADARVGAGRSRRAATRRRCGPGHRLRRP